MYCKLFCIGNGRPVLRDLSNFVSPHIGSKWFILGLQLIDQAHTSVLFNMKEYHHKTHEDQCLEMFNHWLATDSKPTWNKVIANLKAPAVNLHNLAQTVDGMLDHRVSYVTRFSKEHRYRNICNMYTV